LAAGKTINGINRCIDQSVNHAMGSEKKFLAKSVHRKSKCTMYKQFIF